MTAAVIAAAEVRMLVRNKLVAASALLVPLFFAVILLVLSEVVGEVAANAALIVVCVAAVGVYITATTTLAGRRQTLYLKRLRTTAADDRAILLGLLAPVVGVNLVQVAVVLIVLALTKAPPTNPVAFVLAAVLYEALCLGLALATSAGTRSPEHAQITTMPLFLGLFGAGFWVAAFGVSMPLVQRTVPGGAATELLVRAWGTGDVAHAPLLVAVTVAWAVAGAVAGLRMFRWEPRA